MYNPNNTLDNPKIIKAWTFYDWANSVYSLVITSTILPAYYAGVTLKMSAHNDGNIQFMGRTFVGTSLYNYALGIAFLIIALMSPFLSAIADVKGNKKSFMYAFCSLGSLACIGLFFFSQNTFAWGIACIMLSCIGFWSSLVFYNSYLPQIASPQHHNKISARGFAMGYIGSVVLQIICLIIVLKKEWFGIDDSGLAARICFILVGLWWFGFAQIPLILLPQNTLAHLPLQKVNFMALGIKKIVDVAKKIKQNKILSGFLFAFFFYNMGVQTVMLAATLFGSKVLKLTEDKLIITILILQIVAIGGAYLMSQLSNKIGNFKTLAWVVFLWIIICIAAYFVHTEFQFFALAASVGVVMGGIQSQSRSTFSQLIPQVGDTTSYFSFYDVAEKIGIFIGMFSFGYIEELTGSMRNSVLFLILFFGIGLIGLFLIINKQRKNAITLH